MRVSFFLSRFTPLLILFVDPSALRMSFPSPPPISFPLCKKEFTGPCLEDSFFPSLAEQEDRGFEGPRLGREASPRH